MFFFLNLLYDSNNLFLALDVLGPDGKKEAVFFSSPAESNLSEATGEFHPFERLKAACFSFLINKEKLLSLPRNAKLSSFRHNEELLCRDCGGERGRGGSNLDQNHTPWTLG